MRTRPSSFDRTFGFILSDISRLVRKEFDRRVRGLGLTRAQWMILCHLDRWEGCTQSHLADVLQVNKITVSRHIDRLARAGWLERREDTKDSRAYALHLKPEAFRTIQRLTRVADQLREEYFRGLSARQQERLVDDLLLVRRNLLELDGVEKVA